MRSRSKSWPYGPGTAFLKKDAPDAAEIQKLEAAHVHFVACGNAMKKQHLEAADLVAGVDVVSAGIVEVVRKQEAVGSTSRPVINFFVPGSQGTGAFPVSTATSTARPTAFVQ